MVHTVPNKVRTEDLCLSSPESRKNFNLPAGGRAREPVFMEGPLLHLSHLQHDIFFQAPKRVQAAVDRRLG